LAINFSSKLTELRQRRLGIDRDFGLILERASIKEAYEARAQSAASRYALGAMAEVNPRYTEISVEECVRIANQLTKNLGSESVYCDYRLQGSVPTNTHIRGISDVDFLVIIRDQHWFDRNGPKANQYVSYSGDLFQDLKKLRTRSEAILKAQFPAAHVDCNGAKSVKISGGSLKREVDVVPSAWFNSVNFQTSDLEKYRGVDILDKSVPTTIRNFPFLHISNVNDKARESNDGMKMAVRLLKNIKNDSDRGIKLSSYEIAGLLWSCPPEWVAYRKGFDLAVLVGVEKFLSVLASDYEFSKKYRTPDDTRLVMDEVSKFGHLVVLSQEVTALLNEAFAELPNLTRIPAGGDLVKRRAILAESYVP
jgi:hypothetical protein